MTIEKYFVEDWRDFKKWWSMWGVLIQVVFWSIMLGVYTFLPAFIGVIPAPIIMAVGIVMSLAIGIARLFKQPGTVQ